MGPTYATGDPMELNYSGDGLVMEETADDRIGDLVPIPNPRMVVSNPGNPRRMAMHRGYRGFGQTELVATESPGFLDSLGNALGDIIRTIGVQAPGMITGQPTSGYYPTTYQPPSAFGGISPILLIGGGVFLLWYLSKK
jgi:hypothetical protein